MLRIFDLSERLPGPYASMLLKDHGCHIIRIEDTHKSDPFNSDEFKVHNPLFFEWYKKINDGKSIKKFKFFSEEFYAFLNDEITNKNAESTIIIFSKGTKKAEEVYQRLYSKVPLINILASKSDPKMHDLNVLAKYNLLNMHLEHFKDQKVIAPPFLPMAGITFGHMISELALVAAIKKEAKILPIYLDECIENSLYKLGSKSSMNLHNGKFPSYNIYRLKDDQFVAIALIEESLWDEFIKIAKLNLNLEDRFSRHTKITETLINYFYNLSSEEISKTFSSLSGISIIKSQN